jgi:hypothetical protein
VSNVTPFAEKNMAHRTCAACDCTLDADSIGVKIGGKTVEVCCEDCAQKLKEADASTRSKRRGYGLAKGLT